MDIQTESENRQQLTTAHDDYARRLNAHAFFRVPDRAISEDLVQETFIKTWRYLVRGGKIELMKAFLYHVLNHLIVDEYRKKKTISLEALQEKGFEPSINETDTFLTIMDGKAAQELIYKLPAKYQVVMRMKYVQDLSYSEMSILTGQSENTLAVQAHRGLKKLKLLVKHA